MRCPACFVPMSRVVETVNNAPLKSDVCPQCYGTWMSEIALSRRTRLDAARAANHLGQPSPDHAPATPPPLPVTPASPPSPTDASLQDLAALVSETDCKKELRCPSCGKCLLKSRFHPLIPVTVDRCRPCNSLWLDAGELPIIRRLFTELANTDDPKLVRLREKAGLAQQYLNAPLPTPASMGVPSSNLTSLDFSRHPAASTLSTLIDMLTPL